MLLVMANIVTVNALIISKDVNVGLRPGQFLVHGMVRRFILPAKRAVTLIVMKPAATMALMPAPMVAAAPVNVVINHLSQAPQVHLVVLAEVLRQVVQAVLHQVVQAQAALHHQVVQVHHQVALAEVLHLLPVVASIVKRDMVL